MRVSRILLGMWFIDDPVCQDIRTRMYVGLATAFFLWLMYKYILGVWFWPLLLTTLVIGMPLRRWWLRRGETLE
jgi:hypothetical protein